MLSLAIAPNQIIWSMFLIWVEVFNAWIFKISLSLEFSFSHLEEVDDSLPDSSMIEGLSYSLISLMS